MNTMNTYKNLILNYLYKKQSLNINYYNILWNKEENFGVNDVQK